MNLSRVLPMRLRLLLLAGLITAGALAPAARAAAQRPAHSHGTAELVLRWYDLTTQTVAAAHYQEPVTQSRAWAVSWLAAARAVGHRGNPGFRTAAFATALHDTLAALVPAQQSQLNDALAQTLSGVPDGPRKADGSAAGAGAADATLAEREGDGLDYASLDIPWSPPPAAPGVWQPTPPTFGPAVRAGQGAAQPFLLGSGDRFRPGPPPALDSSRYLDALAEVRGVGGAASTTRTPEQTDVARFWAQNSIDAYAQVLRTVLAETHRPLAWQTDVIAAFHAVTTDAQIAIYDAKYAYVFWRPVTAIRAGTVDADPSWAPLINTPRHPEYPSGHTGYAGAAQQVLRALAGPRPAHPVSVTSSTAPGSTHTFDSWAKLTSENIDARVWSGIHFRFSDEVGADVGQEVARYDLRRLGELGL
jgi:hypothetical protein